jgi:diadenosine tetraphosphate (Ap4A) HIT family hydrolase
MCILCEKVERWREGSNPFVIHEFKRSLFVVGEHQYFKGYCQLILKKHATDITDLPSEEQSELFSELMTAGKLIKKIYGPYRMNYSVLGNVVEHVHFHLFPRYEEELNSKKKKDPWASSDEFSLIREDEAKEIAENIRGYLESP